ncbi:MAG: hypothetical protein JWN96_2386 [Mycobacterium sp.]|nr:hypothetical protein [Mycobacterium sp.]
MTTRSHPLDLLSRAAQLMSASLEGAAQVLPTRRTPCAEWDLGTLVHHISDSVAALTELISGAPRAPRPKGGCTYAQGEIRRLLQAIEQAPRDRPAIDLTALTGAFELTVHALDVNASTGRDTPLPADLVSTLLSFAPVVLGRIDREGLFDSSYPPSSDQSSDTDRLLAMFGRRSLDQVLGES